MAEDCRLEREASLTEEDVFTLLTEEMAGRQPQPDSRTIVNGEVV